MRVGSFARNRIAVLLALALISCASPAFASPFGLLTFGSVEFNAAFRFVQGTVVDADGNTFSFGWIPLFFPVQGAMRGVSSANSGYNDSDVAFGSAIFQGQSYIDCNSGANPFIPHPTPCAFIRAGVSMGGPPPPFDPVAPSTLIHGSFSVGLDVTLFTDHLGQQIDAFNRGGSGDAIIYLVNDPSSHNWLFQQGTGYIGPVPEPATLGLLGTSLGALALAGVRRSKQKRAPRNQSTLVSG